MNYKEKHQMHPKKKYLCNGQQSDGEKSATGLKTQKVYRVNENVQPNFSIDNN